MPNLLFRDRVLTMHNKMTALSTEKQFFLLYLSKFSVWRLPSYLWSPVTLLYISFVSGMCVVSGKSNIMYISIYICQFGKNVAILVKNSESKHSSADGVFAWLILLGVSLVAINDIVTKAEDLSNCRRYPITNLSRKSFEPGEHIVFMITYMLCSSWFCEIWALCVSWITYMKFAWNRDHKSMAR